MVNSPVFVILSELLEPLSVVSVIVGATGAVVSEAAADTRVVKAVPENADTSTALPPCEDVLMAVVKVD